MKINYKPKNKLEKFGEKIFFLLVDNFPQTFYVGGMVRDLILSKKVTDIDIATEAKPEQVIKLLKNSKINFISRHEKFGAITALGDGVKAEITTFRKDLASTNRYPKIEFIKSPKTDSQRRDFTVNSLYFSQKTGELLDFQNGLLDLKQKHIRFVGQPEKRIKEDPLRIIRALRFCLALHFKLEHKTDLAIEKNLQLINELTKTKIENEINKIKDLGKRKILETVVRLAKNS